MIYIINGEEKTKVKDNWRTWILWRLAKTNISEKRYKEIGDYFIK